MSTFLIFLYQISIQLYGWGIKVAALFHPKAKQWVKGRQGIFGQLSSNFIDNKSPVLWFHCASLGEFEQGRPLIEKIKADYPDYKILLTFFSPSGYEIRKDYVHADFVYYLPLDTPKNAQRFIEVVQPKLVFFVKYEFWYFYLATLQKKEIPYYLIAGVLREHQLFFKPYGKWYLGAIKGFEQLFLQDQSSLEIAKKFGLTNARIAGDPRIDRVVDLAKYVKSIPKIETFKAEKQLMILGSTHPKDEEIFFDFLHEIKHYANFKNWKFLIVPHEIHQSHLAKIEKYAPLPTIRYSVVEGMNNPECSILILDTIGQLSSAYQYGDLVYIGGGFDDGIHNVLEPAVFGAPIIFGPKYHKFKEAKALIQLGGALKIESTKELISQFNDLQNQAKRSRIETINRQYIADNRGATEMIIFYLKNKNII